MRRILRRFAADRSGSVLVELAFIFPTALLLFFGCVQVASLLQASIKAGNAARTIADLVAQQSAVTSAALANFCTGGKLVMAPYSGAALSAAIASVTDNPKTSQISLDWQDDTSCGKGASIANPTAVASAFVKNPGDSVIIVQVTYSYASPFSYVLLPATFSLANTAYARPRNAPQVQCNQC